MKQGFIALLWVALAGVVVILVLPDAETGTLGLAFRAALAALIAYLVLYAFVIDSDEFIPRDWTQRLLRLLVYPISLGRWRDLPARISQNTGDRALEAIGWVLWMGAGVLFFFLDHLVADVQWGLAAVLGFACIAATMKALGTGGRTSLERPSRTVAVEELIFAGTWIVFAAALVLAVWDHSIGPAQAAVIFVLGTLTLHSACAGLSLLIRNQLFAVEGNWGGLGGGVGGWRLSLSAVLLLLAAFFGGAAVMVTRPVAKTPPSVTLEPPTGKPPSGSAAKPPANTTLPNATSAAPKGKE